MLGLSVVNGCSVRVADLHTPKVLRDGRIAGLVKLHRGIGGRDERRLRGKVVKALRISRSIIATPLNLPLLLPQCFHGQNGMASACAGSLRKALYLLDNFGCGSRI